MSHFQTGRFRQTLVNSMFWRLYHVLAFTTAVLLLAGCGNSSPWWDDSRNAYVKPTIAVMKFENRAPFPLGWNIGAGMADILVDRLVATGRYHVLERPELDSVLEELRLQQSGQTRPQNKVAAGRLKNVQYLVKGTVTDFGHVAYESGFLGVRGFDIFGNHNKAVMGLTLYVVDVESGEIICSESLQESVSASDLNVSAVYKNVSFGGSVFYKTPLGKATERVMDRAIRKVTATIASRPWEPKIAFLDAGNVIVNGGEDRRISVGAEYDVVESGAPIIDPDTGDVLGHQPGKTLGRIRIREVHDRFSVGDVIDRSDALRIGQRLQKPHNPSTSAGLTR